MRGVAKLATYARTDFVKFCMVGGSGFVLNLGILTFFYRILGWPVFVSQLIAGEVALFSNFMLHHNWTYKNRSGKKSILHLLWQFHATSWLAIVGTAAVLSFMIHAAKFPYLIALGLAAGSALIWNFVWSKYVIWRHHEVVTEKDSQND